MLKHLQSKGASTHARALGFQKDGWSCGYELLQICDEVVGHHGSREDVDIILTPLSKIFIKEALRIINLDRSVPVPGTIPENGWEEEVRCWKPGDSPLALAADSEYPPPHLLPPSFLMKRILFCNPRAMLPPPPWCRQLENLLPPDPPTARTCPQMGSR